MAKRKARMGSKDVATAYTMALKQKRQERGNVKRRKRASQDLTTELFLRQQANDRWPTAYSCDRYHEFNIDKNRNRGASGRKKAPEFFFPLMEELDDKTRDRVLLCASLEIKKIRRYPGWILSRTYNLKNRVVDFS